MMGRRTQGQCCSRCWIIWVMMWMVLELVLVTLVGCVGEISEGGGFTASRFPGLNLFALQCNGSHLPSDVRSVQHISLERHSGNHGTTPHIIASLSSVDGVRLENSHGNANVYVSGKFDVDNIQATSLTVLLADVMLDLEVTYGCKISYIKRGGSLEITERLLNVSFTNLEGVYQVQTGDSKNMHQQQRLAQAKMNETKEVWGTPMILLLTMAVLLFALFVVCVLLIIDRYRDHYRNRRRMSKLERKKGGSSKDVEAETEARPLPSPPAWTYPQVIGAPPPRSPYNRLRFGGVGRTLRGVA